MKQYYEGFKFCPRCGVTFKPGDFKPRAAMFRCGSCSLEFYQNTKPAVAVIIPRRSNPAELLFTRRNMEPCRGRLDFPGGFLNYHEDPVLASVREAKEEIKIEVRIQTLFFANLLYYPYQGTEQSELTLYYLAEPVEDEPGKIGDRENAECCFHRVQDILANPEQLAFPADRDAVEKYVKDVLRL
jgi:NAD+ diphosphatase